MKIKYINYGTGNRVGNIIYLNSALKSYPELHTAILTHEKNHSSGFTWGDFMQDLKLVECKGLKKEYYKFVWENPSSWLNFLPIMKLDNSWAIDFSILIIWILGMFITAGLLYIFI